MKTGRFTTMLKVNPAFEQFAGQHHAILTNNLRRTIANAWSYDLRPKTVTFSPIMTTELYVDGKIVGELLSMQALVVLVNPQDAEIGEYVELHPNPFDDQPKLDSRSPYHETRDFELAAISIGNRQPVTTWKRTT